MDHAYHGLAPRPNIPSPESFQLPNGGPGLVDGTMRRMEAYKAKMRAGLEIDLNMELELLPHPNKLPPIRIRTTGEVFGARNQPSTMQPVENSNFSTASASYINASTLGPEPGIDRSWAGNSELRPRVKHESSRDAFKATPTFMASAHSVPNDLELRPRIIHGPSPHPLEDTFIHMTSAHSVSEDGWGHPPRVKHESSPYYLKDNVAFVEKFPSQRGGPPFSEHFGTFDSGTNENSPHSRLAVPKMLESNPNKPNGTYPAERVGSFASATNHDMFYAIPIRTRGADKAEDPVIEDVEGFPADGEAQEKPSL